MDPDVSPPQRGEILGGYRVERVISTQGAFSTAVVAATKLAAEPDDQPARPFAGVVALKLVVSCDESGCAMLQHEASMLKVEHHFSHMQEHIAEVLGLVAFIASSHCPPRGHA